MIALIVSSFLHLQTITSYTIVIAFKSFLNFIKTLCSTVGEVNTLHIYHIGKENTLLENLL
jgi:hypothetical protein